jgi:hypothetical protein
MISRRTTKIIASTYNSLFSSHTRSSTTSGSRYHLLDTKLYDFLYIRDYDPWFLNSIRHSRLIEILPHGIEYERELIEFILRLNTGETLVSVTQDWSWENRKKLGQDLLFHLSEDIVNYMFEKMSDKYLSLKVGPLISPLVSNLELDGYIYKGNKLFYSEASVFDEAEEQGILEKLIRDLHLDNHDLIRHHMNLSNEHYEKGNWGDSISNSRNYMESVLREIVKSHYQIKNKTPINEKFLSRAVDVRDYLEKENLLSQKDKKTLSEVYGLLSETGSHPFMAEKDQARLMRHLALTFSQFVLLRYQGFLKSNQE